MLPIPKFLVAAATPPNPKQILIWRALNVGTKQEKYGKPQH